MKKVSTYTDLSGKKHNVKHTIVNLGEPKEETVKRISRELCEIFSKSASGVKG